MRVHGLREMPLAVRFRTTMISGFAPGFCKGAGGVVFAVGAREHGDHDLGLQMLVGGSTCWGRLW